MFTNPETRMGVFLIVSPIIDFESLFGLKKDIDMVNNKKYSSHKYKMINIIKNKCLKIDKNE